MFELVVVKKDDSFERSRAFRERLCESGKTIIDVDLDSALKAICHTFLLLSITLSFEEEGRG